jgi:hypothetical protein
MWLYLIIFAVPMLMFIFSTKVINRNIAALAFVLLPLSLFVGLSDMFGGYDRYIYAEVFDGIANVTTEGGSYVGSESFLYFGGEFGYTLLNIIISFYTANRYIFILSITLIIYLLLFIDLKRYTDNYPFALVLFLGLWFFFTFTYLRQVLGVTVAWLGIRYVIERKPIKFFLVCFIAYSLHNSAIIFLPLYFIPVRKYSARTIVLIMALALIFGLSPLPNALFQTYADNSVVERHSEYNATNGFRIEYLLEASFFLSIILFNYHKLPNTRKHTVLLNMALVFCAILLFFIRSENGGRIGWYYIIGLISTLTTICVNKRTNAAMPLMMIVVSLLLYLKVYTGWNVYLNLYPYKTFFTNGYREGDYSWENYEYNHDYDYDKFCREPLRWKPNI